MKIFRRILLILTLIIFTILVISSIYLKNGYEIYFNLGFIKLGNSNINIIYILSGLILLIWAIYFLIKQIITKNGIIISISLFFTIFLLPFVFLISCGMNRNHSFTYKTESNKDILIMGYGKNTDTINMKYVFYERLVLGYYEKIGEIESIDYILSVDNISNKKEEIKDETLYYYENEGYIYFIYLDDNNEVVEVEMKYNH